MHFLKVCCALNWTPNTIHTPISSTSILSRPTGPKELFTILAMEQAAITGTKKEAHCEKGVHITVFLCSGCHQIPQDSVSYHCTASASHPSVPGFKSQL